MAHVAKYTKGATGQLCQHYERKQNENGEYIKFGNQDIDLTKTPENYNLAPYRQEGQVNFIRERCHELNCLKRSDVNVMASWVITLPKDFPKEQEKEFFEQSYKFLQNRYRGEKNVISAYVHKDEVTPHMHFAFVPVVYDQKKNREKVSAKECINKKDLLTFHKDLSKHMENYFGKDIGILNEKTKEGNKSIEELKRQSATDRLKEVTEKITEMNQELQSSSKKLKRILSTKKDVEMCLYKFEKFKAKKSLFGRYTLNKNEYLELIEIAQIASSVLKNDKKLEEINQENLRLKKENEKLIIEYKKCNVNEVKITQLKMVTEIENLKRENLRLKNFIQENNLQEKYELNKNKSLSLRFDLDNP